MQNDPSAASCESNLRSQRPGKPSAPAASSGHPGIDAFIDALWLEEGLSNNNLSAYRRDLEAEL